MLRVSDLIGVPFKDGGRSPAGMDCSGLVQAACKLFGYTVPDPKVSCYDSLTIAEMYEEWSSRPEWMRVPLPEPGDIAVMSIDPRMAGRVHHLGVYIGGGRVLHTLEKRESHLVRIDDPYWSRKIRGWYRWVGC